MRGELLVATTKGLFTIARGERRWEIRRTSFLGDNVTMVLADPRDGAIYATLGHGHFGVKVHRSDDDGATFTQIATPKYPEKPEGLDEKDQWGKPFPWTLQRIWALEAATPDRPGKLWCGTVPGGMFYSNDRGATWEMLRSLWDDPRRTQWFGGGLDHPGIHSIAIDPTDGDHITLGVSCGGVWDTRDAGTTWELRATGMWAAFMPPDKQKEPNIQDPHQIVRCPAAPDSLWAQHHNGIFRTVDGAKSWQDVSAAASPSSFGFAVAVHPADADTAWFVPAIKDEKRIPVDGKVVVSRTRDGGKSFTVLRDGLPQDNAYDLCYRHSLDVDASGQHLAFGSTTGSLWVSDDQGDHWTTVSKHLPPIVAVRFSK